MDILKVDQITPEQIYLQLQEFIKNKNDVAWTDFAEASSGNSILQALSAVGGLLNFNMLLLEREHDVTTMSSYDSAVVLCNMHGYPVNRKTSPLFELKINVSQNTTINRNTILGYMNEYPIVPIDAIELKQGDNVITVTLGSFQQVSWSVSQAGSFYSYYIEESDLAFSNQLNTLVNLKVNGVDCELVADGGDLDETNALCNTVVGGVLLMFGDNKTGIKIEANDYIELEYLRAVGYVDPNLINNNSFVFYIEGKTTLTEYKLLEYGYQEDEFKKLITLAPSYRATKQRMITYHDFELIFQSKPGIMSCKYAGKQNPFGVTFDVTDDKSIIEYMEAVNAVYLAYISKPDPSYTSPEEIIIDKDAFVEQFDNNIILGTFIKMVDSELIYVSVKLSAVVAANIDKEALKDNINEQIRLLTLTLGGNFRLSDIDNIMKSIPEILRYIIHTPYSDCSGMEYTQYLKVGRVYDENGVNLVDVGDIDISFYTDINTSFNYQTEDTGYYKYDENGLLRRGFWNYDDKDNPIWYFE